MKKTLTIALSTLTIVALSGTASAWVEPDQLPPNGNIAAPLNTGSLAQSKIGGLILNIGNALYGLIVKNGNSGFGTETPTERVDVNGNIKLNGRIIGLQAPTDQNDAVNKGYVDAMGGGGGTVTGYGTTDCPTGWTKYYDGVAMSAVGHWGGGSSGLSSMVCKKGEGFLGSDSGNVYLGWITQHMKTYNGTIPCAVCVK